MDPLANQMDVAYILAFAAIFLGLILVIMIMCTGWKAFSKSWCENFPSFAYTQDNGKIDLAQKVSQYQDIYRDYLDKRNEFWFGFGQIVITAVIIIVLTVLLLVEKISQEAGLPILSALSGFAIAKTVNSAQRRGGKGETGENG
jgi:hypothetical protein